MRARSVLIVACLSMLFPATRATDLAVNTSDTQPAVLALQELRRAWFSQLDELIDTARKLAVADDTYEFLKRPNIPYVYAHFDREDLAAERIDTVLIVNRHKEPLFWRRVNQGNNRGFPDARLFLAELPRLPATSGAGVPSLAGAVTLVHGPKLLVAMPIYSPSGSDARGWLIATRALDASQWHRYEEFAHVPVQLVDPRATNSPGDVEAALQEPLSPIVRVEAKHIRGLMAVTDLEGKPFRVFSVSLVRPEVVVVAAAAAAPAPVATSLSFSRSARWVVLVVVITSALVALLAVGSLVGQSRKFVWRRTPRLGNAQPAGEVQSTSDVLPASDMLPASDVLPASEVQSASGAPLASDVRPASEAASSGASEIAVAPTTTSFSSPMTRDPLRGRFAASNAVFRYQPQIDLQTGQVAGVEALLCVPGLNEFRPAIELAAEIEASGLGLALVERRLNDACREQRAWLRIIGHEFPIGVPVSQRTLVNAAFLPMVRRILAENELAASFLELEVEESALGPSAAALRSVTQVRDAGISIAIDGFNAAHSNLRLLSILPISKLRVDPFLLLRVDDGPSEALLFDGIIGAARGLGILVCATGIASQELLSTVLRHGRPLAQGAALGPLLAGGEFFDLLRGSGVDTQVLRPLDFGEAALQGSM
jgi:EAL domain-containing protein (putative c-di-GMP-specific phosphodiesterase class I)/sensor domain CHASE-containing protein